MTEEITSFGKSVSSLIKHFPKEQRMAVFGEISSQRITHIMGEYIREAGRRWGTGILFPRGNRQLGLYTWLYDQQLQNPHPTEEEDSPIPEEAEIVEQHRPIRGRRMSEITLDELERELSDNKQLCFYCGKFLAEEEIRHNQFTNQDYCKECYDTAPHCLCCGNVLTDKFPEDFPDMYKLCCRCVIESRLLAGEIVAQIYTPLDAVQKERLKLILEKKA